MYYFHLYANMLVIVCVLSFFLVRSYGELLFFSSLIERIMQTSHHLT
uniref:Uncharacterized protein n=1 Tax=Arundo donax TaxID=35708 RepID=A0A0A9ANR5_ARUDO